MDGRHCKIQVYDETTRISAIKEKLESNHIAAKATLKRLVEQHILNAIESKAKVSIVNIANKHKVEEMSEFRTLYTELQTYCVPNVSVSVELSRKKYARSMPVTSSIQELVDAIRIHETELALLPVLDANGQQTYDVNGEIIYHKPDEAFMHTTLCSQLNDPSSKVKSDNLYQLHDHCQYQIICTTQRMVRSLPPSYSPPSANS